MAPDLRHGYTFADEEVAAMLADTVEHALVPPSATADSSLTIVTLQTIAEALNRHIDQEVAALTALQEEVTL